MSDSFNRFINIIREIFQFDTADLDFGIYRILNEKREQIEDYLNDRLPQVVDQAFAQYTESDREKLQEQLDALRQQLENAAKVFGQPAFDESGELVAALRGGEVGKEYLAVQGQLEQIEASADLKRSVYNDLANFFERYYQDGDYISKRKRGRDEKYVIPYDGQEVVLYWANQDQYYVKTGEQFRNYRFKAGEYIVQFELRSASTAQNNNKGNRYFVLAGKDAIHWDEPANTLTLYFEYRLLTDKEQQQHGRTAQQQPQDSLNNAGATTVISTVKDATLKAHLAQVKEGKTQNFLLQHLTQFTRRNTADFFIHKDLAAFLLRELEFFIKNEVLVLDDLIGGTAQATGDQIRRARVVRDVGHNIISLLAQIEDFQKRLFEKKKFVTRTEYCVTIDRVPEGLWPQVLANEAQLAEWCEFYALDDLLAEIPLLNNGITEATLRQYPSLVVDTRHFDQPFKDRLLATFDDLDAATDGLLIHSENWQALNLLAERYRKQVKCIYIDPPYNTNASEIMYRNGYKHSSWLVFMENKLLQAKQLLQDEGIICITIDDVEYHRLHGLLLQIFGEESILGTVPIRSNPAGRSTVKGMSIAHEYAVFVSVTEEATIGRLPRSQKQLERYKEIDQKGAFEWVNFRKHGGFEAGRAARPRMYYPIYAKPDGTIKIPEMEWNEARKEWKPLEQPEPEEMIVLPVTTENEEKRWKWGYERVLKNLSDFCARPDITGQTGIYMKSRMKEGGTLPTTWWDKKQYSATEYGTNLLGRIMGSIAAFSFPKSVHATEDCLRTSNLNEDDLSLDFFAGSGTTGHAVINLNREDGGNRRYILVEMGDYFNTALLTRIKKVIFSDSWKDGKPQDSRDGISQLVKYHALEQYEDTLNSMERPRQQEGQLAFTQLGDPYLLRYMLDFETQGSPSLLNIEALQAPFTYRLTIHNGLEAKETAVDLVETFNYLLGLMEKQRRAFDHDGRRYVAVWGTQGRDNVIIVWRDTSGVVNNEEGLLADRDFIRDTIIPAFLGDGWPDRLLVNGMAMAERDGVAAESLDGLFHQLMFAGVAA